MIVADRSSMGSLGFMVGLTWCVSTGRPRPRWIEPERMSRRPQRPRFATQLLRPGDPGAHGIPDAGLESLRAILRKGVEDRVVPGVSLLLAHRGEVVFKEAFGNMTLDQKAKTPASSSKPVTATLLMILFTRASWGSTIRSRNTSPNSRGSRCTASRPPRCRQSERALQHVGPAGRFLHRVDTQTAARASGQGGGAKVAKGRRRTWRKAGASYSRHGTGRWRSGSAPWPRRPRDRTGGRVPLLHDGLQCGRRLAEAAAERPFEEMVRTELLEPLGMRETRSMSSSA